MKTLKRIAQSLDTVPKMLAHARTESQSPRGGQRIKSNRLRLSKLKAPTTHKTHAAQSRVRQYTQHAGNNIQKTKKQKNKKKQK
jgi:hypothetical protein